MSVIASSGLHQPKRLTVPTTLQHSANAWSKHWTTEVAVGSGIPDTVVEGVALVTSVVKVMVISGEAATNAASVNAEVAKVERRETIVSCCALL